MLIYQPWRKGSWVCFANIAGISLHRGFTWAFGMTPQQTNYYNISDTSQMDQKIIKCLIKVKHELKSPSNHIFVNETTVSQWNCKKQPVLPDLNSAQKPSFCFELLLLFCLVFLCLFRQGFLPKNWNKVMTLLGTIHVQLVNDSV